MRVLESYVGGSWVAPRGPGTPLRDAVTGDPVASVTSEGIDLAAAVEHARRVGGPALREMTFHERAFMLKGLGLFLLEHKEGLYDLSTSTGATRADSAIDIDGGAGVILTYASKGRRELPNSTVLVDGAVEALSRDGSFAGVHVATPLRGVALQINAFNFPCWGMLEKLGPAMLAGVPSIVKPASQTAYLTEELVRLIASSGLLPDGAVQLVCGGAGGLLDHLTGQDVVSFTGSATTARLLRTHPVIVEKSVRFNAETDSLNAAILAPSAVPGSAEFHLFVAEVAREMTSKAGQKCTAIRRVLVPSDMVGPVTEALVATLAAVRVGHPADPATTMGALASLHQREEVRRAVADLSIATRPLLDSAVFHGVDPERGAFLAPVLLLAEDPGSPAVHGTEAFGPVSTVVPFRDIDDAVALAALGSGSLVASIFGPDPAENAALTLGVASHHGRVLVVDEACGSSSTGHGSPLPHLVHGGPGRAGGGEELGGVRGVMHYLQRTAVQGSPDMLTAVTGRHVTGATRRTDKGHPFRLHFEDLDVGDSVLTGPRTITLDDIERFAALTGDTFYAHMDEEAAAANPIFDGRVAHGYLVLAAAAGLFVQPDPGPVLANYGLERLRFVKPVYPGDAIRVRFTCKEKTLREGTGYGEVSWDTEVVNQHDELVASYDVLTMVASAAPPQEP